MSLTNFPHGIFATPVIGAVGRFAGLWNKRVFFVDGDNGSDDGAGTEIDTPFKTIQHAVTAAGRDDTIYIRPKTSATNWDTLYGATAPTSTYLENISVTVGTKNGLSIIGTAPSKGRPAGGGVQLSGVSAIVSPAIDILSPMVNVENILFGCMAAQVTVASPVIRVYNYSTTGLAYGVSIVNCGFEVNTNAEGCIRVDNAPGTLIAGCSFRNIKAAIYFASLDHTVDCGYVEDNRFTATALTLVSGCVVADTMYNLQVLNNRFNHGTPNLTGGYKKYIYCAGTVSGGVQGNMFGVTGSALGSINTLSNLTGGGNFDLAGAMTT